MKEGKENFYIGDELFENILLPDPSFPKEIHEDFRLFIQETELNTQLKLTQTIKKSFPNILIVDSQALTELFPAEAKVKFPQFNHYTKLEKK